MIVSLVLPFKVGTRRPGVDCPIVCTKGKAESYFVFHTSPLLLLVLTLLHSHTPHHTRSHTELFRLTQVHLRTHSNLTSEKIARNQTLLLSDWPTGFLLKVEDCKLGQVPLRQRSRAEFSSRLSR